MTAVKTHSMALKEVTLNPTSSTSGWVCRLVLSVKGGQCLAVYLTSEDAVKLAPPYSEPLLKLELGNR